MDITGMKRKREEETEANKRPRIEDESDVTALPQEAEDEPDVTVVPFQDVAPLQDVVPQEEEEDESDVDVVPQEADDEPDVTVIPNREDLDDELMCARTIESGNIERLNNLLAKNPNIFRPISYLPGDITPLQLATLSAIADNQNEERIQIVEKLCSIAAIDKNKSGFSYSTPLGLACTAGRLDLVKILLPHCQLGERTSIPGEEEEFLPIEIALKKNHIEIFQTLLKDSIHASSDLFKEAIDLNRHEILELLAANQKGSPKGKMIALAYAIKKGNSEAERILREATQ